MKKILALGCLLVAAAACANQPPSNKEVGSNANRPVETKSAPPSESDMIVNEKKTWETLQKKDYDAFDKLLASEYTEVRDDGVFDKAGTLVSVKDLSITDVTYSDWKTMSISRNAYAITYTVTVKGSVKGQAFPPDPYHAASAWVHRDGQWLAIYYQETPAKSEPPPAPSPAASAPSKAAVSPAAKPAEAGPDPIANEKLVWDAFKSRNYDVFAALLAPEFTEVETAGVYDKAASVKGLTGFDASKYELSDWKAVKFDNDAAMVTYLVTTPTKDKERHSSIWANRDGKWLALMHVGTPAAKPEKK
jgi:hypothetical protein